MRRFAAIALAAGLAFGLAACGEDKVDRQGTIDEIVEEGLMNEEQATCMVNAVADELGDEKLLALENEETEMSPEDEAKMLEITTECLGLGDLTEDLEGLTEDLDELEGLTEDLEDLDVSIPEE